FLKTSGQEQQEQTLAQLLLFTLCAEEKESCDFQVSTDRLTDPSRLTLKKWDVIHKLRENPGNPRLIQELREVRKNATDSNLWDEVRDCDRFEAVFTKNERLFMNVYFGTPSEFFKQKMRSDWRVPLNLPRFYDWNIPGGGTPTESHKSDA